MNKVIKETEVNSNVETGEILSISKRETVLVGKEPAYFKFYIEDISSLFGLNPAQQSVFQCLASSMGFDNVIVLIKPIKRRLAEKTGYSENTITKVIDQLYQKDILLRLEKSVYRVNPKFVAKGSWENIKAMRLIFEYNAQGRTMTIEQISSKAITLKEEVVISEPDSQLTFEDAIEKAENQ